MNLLATGSCAAITKGFRLLIAPSVLREAIYIYSDDQRTAKRLIDEELLSLEAVAFSAIDLSAPEIALSVQFAANVDDGEAETLAVATSRGLDVLTDDIAGLRLAKSLKIRVVTTLDLVQQWAAAVDANTVANALKSLRLRANYAVPRSHHLAQWYAEHLTEDPQSPP